MLCRVVYILIMCHLSALGDVVNILFFKEKRKRKIFLLYFAIRRHNEGVVTYGIRADSTRDLGFTTDVLITVGVLGVLHLTCVLGRL